MNLSKDTLSYETGPVNPNQPAGPQRTPTAPRPREEEEGEE